MNYKQRSNIYIRIYFDLATDKNFTNVPVRAGRAMHCPKQLFSCVCGFLMNMLRLIIMQIAGDVL